MRRSSTSPTARLTPSLPQEFDRSPCSELATRWKKTSIEPASSTAA